MKYINLHTHDKYSDGKGDPADFINSAIEKKMGGIGFSSHSPVPLPNSWSMKLENTGKYIEDINNQKVLFKKEIPVYLGLELDYIENLDVKSYIGFDKLNLDFYLAAVHYIYIEKLDIYDTVDDNITVFKKILEEGFDHSMESFYTKYFETYRMMINEYRPLILAHLDLIKKNNGNNVYYNENDESYVAQVLMTLDEIKKHDCVLEVNTGGMSRGYTSDTYPSLWILKECRKRKIRVTVNADAHQKDNIDFMFDFAVSNIRKAGYTSIYQFVEGTFKEHAI
ncbi:MAG: histidinol-phosphatase [Clostridia bacterium]|nr:histidinol-phosphatase [Clostridia bacterium]